MYLRTKTSTIYRGDEIADCCSAMNADIMAKNEHFVRNESNLEISRIYYVSIALSRFAPLDGNQYQELPELLESKRAMINVQNKDNRCFGYAILSALHPQTRASNRPQLYSQYFEPEGLNRLHYPISPTDIPEIDNILNIKVNVFGFFDDQGKGRYPIYVSKKQEYRAEIDLLYWNEHYAWIKRFSAFIYDLSPKHSMKFFCKRCFGVFLTKDTFARHETICDKRDFDSVLYRFPPPDSIIRFKSIRNQLRAPFIIVADFECLLIPSVETDQKAKKAKSELYASHIPCSAGFDHISSSEEHFKSEYHSHTGPDVVDWLMITISSLVDKLVARLQECRALEMTQEDWVRFNQ